MLTHSAAEIRVKKVLAIISLLFLVLNGNAQESLDTIKSFRLSEVVVKAERIIHKGDHDVLYLSNDNKKFGTNALDAVSWLSKSGVGIALLLEPTEKFGLQKEVMTTNRHSLSFILKYLKEYRKYLFQIFLGFLFGCVLQGGWSKT